MIRADVRLATQAAANRARAQIAAGDIDGVALELDRLAAVAQGLEPRENAQMLIHLGRSGAEKIIEMELNEGEKAKLDHSAHAVRNVVEVLGY